MNVRIHADAEEELYQAALWYEDRMMTLDAASKNVRIDCHGSKHCLLHGTSGGRSCVGSPLWWSVSCFQTKSQSLPSRIQARSRTTGRGGLGSQIMSVLF